MARKAFGPQLHTNVMTRTHHGKMFEKNRITAFKRYLGVLRSHNIAIAVMMCVIPVSKYATSVTTAACADSSLCRQQLHAARLLLAPGTCGMRSHLLTTRRTCTPRAAISLTKVAFCACIGMRHSTKELRLRCQRQSQRRSYPNMWRCKGYCSDYWHPSSLNSMVVHTSFACCDARTGWWYACICTRYISHFESTVLRSAT